MCEGLRIGPERLRNERSHSLNTECWWTGNFCKCEILWNGANMLISLYSSASEFSNLIAQKVFSYNSSSDRGFGRKANLLEVKL